MVVFFCADAPPVADAGTDVTIRLPENFVTIDGTRSTDDQGIVAYQWMQTYGDDGARLVEDASAKSRVGIRKAGEYVYRLTVFDKLGQSDDDDVRVTVLGKSINA